MKRLTSTLLILALHFSSYSQQVIVDSLLNVLSNTSGPAKRVSIMLDITQENVDLFQDSIAMVYVNQAHDLAVQLDDSELILDASAIAANILKLNAQYDTAKFIALKNLQLANRIDYAKGVINAYDLLGSIHYNKSNLDSAVYYHQLVLPLKVSINDLAGIAKTYNNLGIAYDDLGEYAECLNAYKKSLKIRLDLGQKAFATDVYNNIGAMYSRIGDHTKAIENLQQGLKMGEELKIPIKQSASYANLGVVYFNLEDYNKAIDTFQKVLDIQVDLGNRFHESFALNGLAAVHEKLGEYVKALELHKRALAIREELENPIAQSVTLNNIGVAFHKMAIADSAEFYFHRAISLKNEFGDFTGLAKVYNNMGSLFFTERKYDKSLNYYELGLEQSEKIGLLLDKRDALLGLCDNYKAQDDFSTALDYHEQYMVMKDSVLNEERTKQIAEIETRFETEKKVNQIAFQASLLDEQQLVIEKNQLVQIIMGVLIVALILIGVLIQNRRKLKERAMYKSLQLKAVIDTQESERKRFARDLHDGFGQLISALKLNVSGLAESDQKKAYVLVNNSTSILDQMYHDMKDIVFDLMPQTLMTGGLIPAVNELSKTISKSGQLNVRFDHFGFDTGELSDDKQVSLYRVIQEIISNIVKHAHATEINIQITGDGNGATIMIEDNGQGYDPDQFKSGTGNGWKNLISRLELLNGSIEIDSKVGSEGSTVVIELTKSEGLLAA
ncbi:MAG: sensor histidine kinase [Cyclobacteriaceae bacterium]